MNHRLWPVAAAAIWGAIACVPEGDAADNRSVERRGQHTRDGLSLSVDAPDRGSSVDDPSAPGAARRDDNWRSAPKRRSDAAPEGPDLVLVLPWGSTGRAVGRLDGDEASSEGPMSFAVTASGETYVLDQVNLRVLVFAQDGGLRREVPIPGSTYQDIEVTDDGTILLLDRLANPSLLVLHESGGILAELPVLGDGIPEGGGITAMFARDDGVWLEFAHAQLVRVLDPGLRAAPRSAQSGRIVQQGTVNVSAALDRSRGTASIWLTDPSGGAERAHAEASFEHPIARIISIDTDATGNIHAFLHVVVLDDTDPRKVAAEKVVGMRYDQNLEPIGMLTSPHVITQWEQFREFRVTAAGAVYQMAFDREGVRFYRWQW